MCIDLYYDRKFKKSDEIENFDLLIEELRNCVKKSITGT